MAGAVSMASMISRNLPGRCSSVYITRSDMRGALRRELHQSTIRSSGHNRWSKIRHKKGAADLAKSAQFSKITTEIYMSLRPPASSDPALNPRLTAILAKAKEIGYPKSNIDQAMNKALNPNEGLALQSITYEAVGPGGQVGLIIECLTDNANRCVSRVKEQLNKFGGRMSPTAFLFERKGLISLSLNSEAIDSHQAFDMLFEAAVEAGAEDVRVDQPDEDGTVSYEVITPPTEVSDISQKLFSAAATAAALPFAVTGVEVAFLPNSPLRLPTSSGEEHIRNSEKEYEGELISEEVADKAYNLVDGLEETGDVVKVWTNVSGL